MEQHDSQQDEGHDRCDANKTRRLRQGAVHLVQEIDVGQKNRLAEQLELDEGPDEKGDQNQRGDQRGAREAEQQ